MATSANKAADKRAFEAERLRKSPTAVTRFRYEWKPLVPAAIQPMREGALRYREIPSVLGKPERDQTKAPA